MDFPHFDACLSAAGSARKRAFAAYVPLGGLSRAPRNPPARQSRLPHKTRFPRKRKTRGDFRRKPRRKTAQRLDFLRVGKICRRRRFRPLRNGTRKRRGNARPQSGFRRGNAGRRPLYFVLRCDGGRAFCGRCRRLTRGRGNACRVYRVPRSRRTRAVSVCGGRPPDGKREILSGKGRRRFGSAERN